MNAPSYDIKDLLVAESALGLEYGVDLFVGLEPLTPKNCVTIFDPSGFPPDLDLDGDGGYKRPSIQIRVRNMKYLTGMALIQSITDFLHGKAQTTVNGTLYTAIICSSGPAHLDWDDNGNARFIVNFNLQRRVA